MKNKWKFFFTHGECQADSPGAWWLKLTTIDEIKRYIEATNGRFTDALISTCNLYAEIDNCPEKKTAVVSDFQHNAGPLAQSLDVLHRNSGQDLLVDTDKFFGDITFTYFKVLSKFGFVNINGCGGCNGCDWPQETVAYRDNLIFPHFTTNDIRIETMELAEKKYAGVIRDNHQYHYYTYIGDIKVTDGDIIKWNTYDDAYAAAMRFCHCPD